MALNIEEVRALYEKHEITEVYEQLLPYVSSDTEAQTLWLEMLRIGPNIFLLADYVDQIQHEADNGNAWMAFAFARYHDIVQPDGDSIDKAEKYYQQADRAGLADAHMYMAFAWRDGEYGMVDRERYCRMMSEAIDRGSHAAVQQQIRELIFGGIANRNKDPKRAYDSILQYIIGCINKGDKIEARYYHLLGDAAYEMGNKTAAETAYKSAYEMGDVTAWYWLLQVRACDDEGNITDEDLYNEMVEEACAKNVPQAFTAAYQQLSSYDYDAYDEDLQNDIHNAIESNLDMANTLGDEFGTYYMALCYYNGSYGFEQDYETAWSWFAKSAIMRFGQGYSMMAKMIEDGEAPDGYDDDFKYQCQVRALRFGDDEMLEPVVDAYRHGHLTELALEIEKYYLPLLEEEDD